MSSNNNGDGGVVKRIVKVIKINEDIDLRII